CGRTRELQELDGEVQGAVAYNADLFDAATIERMTCHLIRVVDTVAAEPTVAVGNIDILSEPERHRVLEGVNDTGHKLPVGTLPSLFAEQVRRSPHATAVVADGVALRYEELDMRANRLAHR